MTRSLALFLLGCAGALAQIGCQPPSGGATSTERPSNREVPRDLLLITVDTLRHDATGFSGAGRVETPLLDQLAANGVHFPNARAHAVMTLPSHASILTGLYPYQHGVHDNAGFVLDGEIPTLATLLREHGFATAAFVSALPLDRRFGLGTGFEVYDDQYEGHGGGSSQLPERPGELTVAEAKSYWDSHRHRRRFLWLHLFTPHFPYAPEEPFASRYVDAPYFGDVAMTDAQLQPLLHPILGDAASSVLIVVTSDHGESLGEHGEQTHGTFAYDATLRVPLVFWSPAVVEPAVDPAPARHVDLVPSALQLLGLPVPQDLPGRSLFLPLPPGHDTGSYFEALSPFLNRGWAPLTGRVEAGRKAIRLPIPELYDLERDPSETSNLATMEPDRTQKILAELPDLSDFALDRRQLDQEIVAKLRSLGYLASSGSLQRNAERDLALDPKRLIGLERMLDAAWSHQHHGDGAAAVEVLRAVLAEQPSMTLAWEMLGSVLVDEGRIDEAIAALQAAEKLGIQSEAVRRILGLALLRADRSNEAWRALSGDATSNDPDTQSALGRVAAARGDAPTAERHFLRALELDPTFPAAEVDLAILRMLQGRDDEARERLSRALAIDGSQAEGWNALGVLRSRQADDAGAVLAWERAVAADPTLPDALYNLALARAQRGEWVAALAAIDRYLPLARPDERKQAEAIRARIAASSRDSRGER